MTTLNGRQGHHRNQDALLQENIENLGRVISSEARGQNNTERAMVGWTIVNRMKQRHAKRYPMYGTATRTVISQTNRTSSLRLVS